MFSVKTDRQGSLLIEGIERRFVSGLESANRRAAEIVIGGISRSAVDTFRNNSPGGLHESFYLAEVSRSGAIIASTKPYAGIHETGGIIRQRLAPWLVYQLADGSWRKTKTVRIPETRYISRGLESKRAELEAWAKTWMLTVVEGAERDARGGSR